MLSARQRAVLDFVLRHIGEHGYPPSVREIGRAVGLSSSSSVHAHLRTLTNLGYVDREPTKSRALRPRAATPALGQGIPVLGTVPAGDPLTAVELWEGKVHLPPEFLPEGELFALRVRGESMIGAGINHGDLVVVRKQPAAENGAIVVALIDDEATLKRFYLEESAVRLEAENPAIAPIVTPQAKILGKVVGHIRRV